MPEMIPSALSLEYDKFEDITVVRTRRPLSRGEVAVTVAAIVPGSEVPPPDISSIELVIVCSGSGVKASQGTLILLFDDKDRERLDPERAARGRNTLAYRITPEMLDRIARAASVEGRVSGRTFSMTSERREDLDLLWCLLTQSFPQTSRRDGYVLQMDYAGAQPRVIGHYCVRCNDPLSGKVVWLTHDFRTARSVDERHRPVCTDCAHKLVARG